MREGMLLAKLTESESLHCSVVDCGEGDTAYRWAVDFLLAP